MSWSLRLNAFELLTGQLAISVEYAPPGQNLISVELEPELVLFDPNSQVQPYSLKGFGGYAKVAFWIESLLQGWNLKAVGRYEHLTYSTTFPDQTSFNEFTLGAELGNQIVFGSTSGFTLSFSMGAGYVFGAGSHLLSYGPPMVPPQLSVCSAYTSNPTGHTTSNQALCISRPNITPLGEVGIGYTF